MSCSPSFVLRILPSRPHDCTWTCERVVHEESEIVISSRGEERDKVLLALFPP